MSTYQKQSILFEQAKQLTTPQLLKLTTELHAYLEWRFETEAETVAEAHQGFMKEIIPASNHLGFIVEELVGYEEGGLYLSVELTINGELEYSLYTFVQGSYKSVKVISFGQDVDWQLVLAPVIREVFE
ncbi:MAG TPA: hypothetical protein DCS93_16955 [Microscillaceae bacterium]|nr:hypothetical protein [Microscillaceae bacterium]